eukprot:1158725-Pelagomonas_calceolata.AAC.1
MSGHLPDPTTLKALLSLKVPLGHQACACAVRQMLTLTGSSRCVIKLVAKKSLGDFRESRTSTSAEAFVLMSSASSATLALTPDKTEYLTLPTRLGTSHSTQRVLQHCARYKTRSASWEGCEGETHASCTSLHAHAVTGCLYPPACLAQPQECRH